MANRTPIELKKGGHVKSWTETVMTRGGVYPICSGEVERSLSLCEDHAPDETGVCPACGARDDARLRFTCTICKKISHGPAFYEVALDHPAVICFYREPGIETRVGTLDPDRHLEWWDLVWQIEQRVVSTDPLRLRIRFPGEGDELRLLLDEEMEVLEVTES